MASLPCEACQEETTVIPTGEIIQDSTGAMAYRRFRVCLTPECDLYLIRRATLEQFLPVTPDMAIISASHRQISKDREVLDRVNPFPFHLVAQSYWDKNENCLFSAKERQVILIAAKHSLIDPHLIKRELSSTLEAAEETLLKLWRIGILRKANRSLLFELIPAKYLPASIRLLHESQRSAS